MHNEYYHVSVEDNIIFDIIVSLLRVKLKEILRQLHDDEEIDFLLTVM